ncbi:hypothetical protein [Paralysiella testudinis]|uniref:DUF3077 domain-containing protein n=1 Tax=Paralysiella testudinis TaxID=2809020 RepID=A0A892ZIT6_9NEIS|nr:hypothetical protein [Paralysiella testudinis]QRQ82348.1 hypothetical protein JQU52_02765 [Paralysiella testudinis]
MNSLHTNTQATPNNMLQAPNGALYYPLSEDAHNMLCRTEGALCALSELLWNTARTGSHPKPDSIGDIVGMAADTLHDILKDIKRQGGAA